MLIANPLYDAVFKFMLEDAEVAKGFLSVILDEEIVELEFKPQETISPLQYGLPAVMRLDFLATILTARGEHKKVLIELQKALELVDIMRFRRYLGKQYGLPDGEKAARKRKKPIAFPIITIYFLGFDLPDISAPVVKVRRQYYDVFGQQEIVGVKNEFIEQLTHDAYVIQILKLHTPLKSQLEKVLSVFNQDFAQEDQHFLKYDLAPEDHVQAMLLRRLAYAVSSDEVQKQMDAEDFIETTLAGRFRDLEVKYEASEKAKMEAENAKLEAENAKMEAENAKLEAEKTIQQQLAELEAMRKKLKELENSADATSKNGES